ncbi:virulence factor [Sphingobium sp. BYY-5]|uniref:virulence factor n=1 Tax=Sphingobium sp. BYY-5 TaxID=2926400 RepID=UPI001FA7763F|nr:virulence factor [Sphingobium sp. BYY-5]MCI4589386.1 virulence factor [Sphingobium sp. BYY-5]
MLERSRHPVRWFMAAALLIILLTVAAMATPVLKGSAIRDFGGAKGAPVAVAFFSGDMGFDFGMSGKVGEAIARRGIPVIGFNSAKYFSKHHSRAEVDGIVADAIRLTLARSGARRIVLMGQSYGADMVATVAPDLPPDLKARLAAVAMIVPAQTVYFRADPLGFAYRGTPDAQPLEAIRRFDAAPLVCIYGLEEEDSLCPPLLDAGAHVTGLPGGHFLHHDSRRLSDTLLNQLQAADPTILMTGASVPVTASPSDSKSG